jgi:hypothetical protein
MKSILAIFIIVISCSASADVSDKQKIEINHLLNFIKNSPCEINRNGQYHKGNDAISHIKKKYDYFRDDISTTEEFIKYSATKSTMSGKYYLVRCGNGRAVKTKAWLLNELKSFREK